MEFRALSESEIPHRSRNGRGSMSQTIADTLRANPGVPHKIEGTSLVTTDFRKGSVPAFQPAGSFDARVSNKELYAWFVPSE
jgi:hypothetical protein